jgi:hypothetical protein
LLKGKEGAINEKKSQKRSSNNKDKGASNRRRLNSMTVNHLHTTSANRKREQHQEPVPLLLKGNGIRNAAKPVGGETSSKNQKEGTTS